MRLDVGDDPHTELVAEQAPVRPPVTDRAAVASAARRVVPRRARRPGDRADWLVGSDVSRVGVRLSAGRFERDPSAARRRWRAKAWSTGAVQITPAGEPIVMLADHPTTGGYPVIGVVDPDDLPIVAQAVPGTTIRFTSRRTWD